jgi:hypothetical protein
MMNSHATFDRGGVKVSDVPKRPIRLPSNPAKVYDLGFKNGAKWGFVELRTEALSFLHDKYMGEDRPDRGSPEAEAILKVTKELSEFMTQIVQAKIP